MPNFEMPALFDDVDVVLNEDGKFNGSDPNRLLYYKGQLIDIQVKLIITTMVFNSPRNDIKVISVNPLIQSSDIYKLESFLSTLQNNGNDDLSYDRIFSRDFFRIYQEKDEYAALDDMIQQLYEASYISDKKTFYESIMKRENIFPTIYDNIWVPHPLDLLSEKTVFSISIIRKNERINLIILCAVYKDDTKKLQSIFDKIAVLLSDEKLIHTLTESNSFEEFMNHFQNI